MVQTVTCAPGQLGSALSAAVARNRGLFIFEGIVLLVLGTLALLATASFNGTTLSNAATLQVPYPSLSSTFNNTGITDDSNTNPSSSFIGFDGIGTSYSAEGLATDGLTPGASVTSGGLNFTWPDVAAAEPMTLTRRGPKRREARPPPKSEPPYSRAATTREVTSRCPAAEDRPWATAPGTAPTT